MNSWLGVFICIACCVLTVPVQAQYDNSPGIKTDDVKQQKNTLFGKLALEQNVPNPFLGADSTVIQYRAFNATTASIIIYSTQGEKILTYYNLQPQAGTLVISGSALPPGTYVYALIINGRIVKKREMFLISSN